MPSVTMLTDRAVKHVEERPETKAAISWHGRSGKSQHPTIKGRRGYRVIPAAFDVQLENGRVGTA